MALSEKAALNKDTNDYSVNDHERELWVMNDEPLYNMWKSSRLSKRDFIRSNRDYITNYIKTKLTSGRR